ncbi:hypothetical protein SNEBB_010531 [Seison nebaliae]|nr:hypothetical protein SNEBB_010531 [Seison nebaliae]
MQYFSSSISNEGELKANKDVLIPFVLPSSTLIAVKNMGGHSISLVRTFNKNWWLVDNDKVQKMENPRKVFNLPEVKTTMNPWVTVWQRVGTSHRILRKLRAVIHPLTIRDLSHL